jgi:hypothetical protein
MVWACLDIINETHAPFPWHSIGFLLVSKCAHSHIVWRLHPNGFLSWDSQSGVPKLSRFGLPRLWATITSRLNLRSRRGLNQTYSPPQELFKSVSHFTFWHRIQVDSRLLVVESRTASLTPDPFFAHNLGYICPNDSCEAILDIYTSRPFQRYKDYHNARCFDP